MGNIDKINRVVLSKDVRDDIDNKATKTEMLNLKSELENQINNVVSNLVRKPSVPTYVDILTTYPAPQEGWTVSVDDTNITYQYDEDTSAWIKTSINAIPKATPELDGLFTKEDKAKFDTIQEYAEKNKSKEDIFADIKTLDGSDSGLDADTVDGKHASDFALVGHDHDGRYYTQSQINTYLGGKQDKLNFTPENSANKNVANGYAGLDANGKLQSNQMPYDYVTQDELGSAGYGDMTKSIYDTNNNGKVDIAESAESVAWTNVTGKPTTFTPSTHNHDGVYIKGTVSSTAPSSPATNSIWIDTN